MVEPFEPGDDPAAVGLEEDEAQAREALEHAAADHDGERLHHVEGVRDRLAEEDVRQVADRTGLVGARHLDALGLELVEAERAARARHVGREERVQADGKVDFLARAPDRVVDRIIELLAVDRRVRAEKDADQAELPRAANDPYRARQILMRHGRDAEQAVRRRRAVLRQPLVVGVGLRFGELGIVQGGETEEQGGVEDRLLDAVAVHVGEARERPEGPRADLAVLHLAATCPLALRRRHPARARQREPVRGPFAAVVAEPLAAVGTGHDLPDAIAELRGRALRHARGRLEDVPVGVDDGSVRHAARLPEAPVAPQGGVVSRRARRVCAGPSAPSARGRDDRGRPWRGRA